MYWRYFILLLFLLIAKAAVMAGITLYGSIDLSPDEAQYWTWSQALDWGYYSKPPGIAWEIWASTFFLGNTEIAVRTGPLVIGFLIPIALFFTAKSCKLNATTCFWSALMMAASPLGVLASFLAITDSGMVLFWIAACICIVYAIARQCPPSYLLIGVCILCGALFKWHIYLLWVAILCAWTAWPRLISWRIIPGMIISLIALLPTVYWNQTHEWATFRHVLSTVAGGHAPRPDRLLAGNFWEFFGAQFALVSPILFILLLVAFVKMFSRKRPAPPAVRFCGILSLVIFLAACVAALFMKIQGNWIFFCYPTAFILIGWYTCESSIWKKGWMATGVVLSVLLCAFAFSIPTIQSRNIFRAAKIPYKINPFRHSLGWDHLANVLHLAGYDPAKDLLISDKYQMTSILSFYNHGQKRAYFINLQGTRKNQFSFWPGLSNHDKHKRAFFVAVENAPLLMQDMPENIHAYEKQLSNYFGTVHFLGINPLFWAYGHMVKGAFIFECSDYNGKLPEESGLY